MLSVGSVALCLSNLQNMQREVPTGSLERSSAPPIPTRFGASAGWATKRLVLDKLAEDYFKVAVYSGRCFLCCGEYEPTQVVIDDHQEMVLINVESMMKRFDLPRDVIVNNLSNLGKIVRIVQEKCLLQAPVEEKVSPREANVSLLLARNPFGKMISLEEMLKKATLEVKVIRLSKRCYGLANSIDVFPGGFIAVDTGKILGKGGTATVKISKTLQGVSVARRRVVFDLYNSYHQDRTLACTRIFNEFSGKVGILDTMALGVYEDKMGRCKFVSFHPLYDQDFSTIPKNMPSKKGRLKMAHTLLQGLQSINEKGIHRDLSYRNVFLRKTKEGFDAVIGDLGFFRYHEEHHYTTANPQIGPENGGMKREVWDLGNVLYYILQDDFKRLPWDILETKSSINQENLDECIISGKFSSEQETLLRGMLAIDPRVRWTVEQSLAYFQTHLTKKV